MLVFAYVGFKLLWLVAKEVNANEETGKRKQHAINAVGQQGGEGHGLQRLSLCDWVSLRNDYGFKAFLFVQLGAYLPASVPNPASS